MRRVGAPACARAPAYAAAWVRVVPYVVEHLCLCVRRAGCRQCVACSVGQPVCVRVCVPVCCSWMSMSTCGVVSARVGISAFGSQVRGRAYARGWLWTGSWACVCALLGACVVGVGGGRSGDALGAGGSICPPKLLGPFTEALEEGTREAISRPPTTPTSGHLDDPCLRPPGSRGPHPPRAAICLGLEIWGGSSRSGGWPVMGSLSFLTPNAHLRGRQKCAGRILALGRNLVNGKEDWIDRRARAPSLNGQVVTEPSPGSASLQSEEHTLLGCRAIGAHTRNAAGVD